jgi:hypothetical protein
VLSKDAFFCSGMTATFDPTDHSVKFDLDPDRSYVLATPWPFAPKDMSRYRNVLPSRDVVGIADPVPGLKVQGPVLLPQTTWEMLEAEGLRRGFKFHRKYPKPRPDWAPWTSYFESKLTVAR